MAFSTDPAKAAQLRAHKRLATGLFLLMAVVYAFTAWLMSRMAGGWLGYVNAFSEAAMVGALADWFAVTALFHHPLGLPIPHTNLIERRKQSIGDNLGAFVASNFLTPEAIRPYLEKLSLSGPAARWLSVEKNKKLIVSAVCEVMLDVLNKMDDAAVVKFLSRRSGDLLEGLKLNLLAASALQYFLAQGGQQALITLLAERLQDFIESNEDVVRERVSRESYFFIPKFIDNKLATKITEGLAGYLEEIAKDPQHRVRHELTVQLEGFVERLRHEEALAASLNKMTVGMLSSERVSEMLLSAWQGLKSGLRRDLGQERSVLKRYLVKRLDEFAAQLREDPELQSKIDRWVRHTAYRYVLRSGPRVGALIGQTVGKWEGADLSRKLELEVGKDLQYIRINGTLVGGLVGLLIYVLTQWLR
jgi:uncharacterized membrane-anchored protein YjiN (DUF445 family)